MKVENIESNNGNKIANQLDITDDKQNEYFQSYNSMIVKQNNEGEQKKIKIKFRNTSG